MKCNIKNFRRAFTLLEMVLVLGVAMLITSAAVWSLGSLGSQDALHEAVAGYESLLRQARVQAMREGRPLRLDLSEPASPRMLLESDPTGQPGRFDQVVAPWAPLSNDDRVQLTGVRRLASGELTSSPTASVRDQADESAQSSLTFLPDGTCDSLSLELRLADDETSCAVVQLDGFTGAVAVHWGPPPEVESSP